MRKQLIILFIATLLLSRNGVAQSFGSYKVETTKAVNAADLSKLAKSLHEANATKTEINDLTFTGKVEEVCQAKGCWMTTKLEDGTLMTIKFKDYAFFMPKDCSGKQFTCHGKLFLRTTSVAELRHLAEDAGKSKKEIKKIKKPQQEVRFEADGVELS